MQVRDPERLATKIRLARKARFWSQDYLGSRCGRSQTAVYLLESGNAPSIDETFALALCRELELPLRDLFGDLDGPFTASPASGPGTEYEAESA